MTDTQTQTTDFKIGDLVKSATGETFETNSGDSVRGETVYRITRVKKNTIHMRVADNEFFVEDYYHPRSVTGVQKTMIVLSTERVKTYLERVINEGEDIISPDDPRVDYIWRAAAKLADERHYCSVYDDITKTLQLPGRPKNFTVNIKVGALTTRVSIKARSKAEATKIAQAQLSEGGTEVVIQDTESE